MKWGYVNKNHRAGLGKFHGLLLITGEKTIIEHRQEGRGCAVAGKIEIISAEGRRRAGGPSAHSIQASRRRFLDFARLFQVVPVGETSLNIAILPTWFLP